MAGGAYSSARRIEQRVQAVGVDLPAHVGVLRLGVAHEARPVGAGADDEAEVVVDAEEVDRRGDRREVAVAHERRDERVALEQVGGVRAAEDRVEEPAVAAAVDLPRGRLVLGRVRRRVRVREVERDPDLRAGRGAPDRLDRPPVREQQVVRRRDGVALARPPGRVLAPRVADPRVDPRLVVRHPVAHAVAEPCGDDLGVLDERLGGLARGPAARVLERLRRVPVEQRRERLDVRARAARRRAGRRSRARPGSRGRGPPAARAATRSRSGTRRARAPSSARRRRG